MPTPDTQVVTAAVSVALASKVEKLSTQLDRPWDWIVNQALSAWVEQEEAFDRLTREGLRDIKDGKVVDHAQMQAWCDSLDSDQPLPMPL